MEQNLDTKDAVKKLIDLTEDIKICMFITSHVNHQHSRPMATIKTDEQGTIWFLSNTHSGVVEEVNMEEEVHLVYANPSKNSYLNVWGKADVIIDAKIMDELWSPIMKAWFPEGKDDPSICIIRVVPEEAYYWDDNSNKMISFLKMVTAAVTGKNIAEGKEGKLAL